jgi:outer membrane protein assembly factor BamB
MHGKQLLMSFSGKRLAGIDRASKQILWDSPYTAMYEQTICNAIPVGNRLIISGEARPTEAVDVHFINGKYELKSAWKNAEMSTYMTNPVILDDALVGFDMRSRRAICVAIATGATLWTSPRIAKQIINVTLIGKHIVIVSDSGEVTVADASTKAWTPLYTYTISEPGSLWSMPCFSGNQMVIRDQKSIRSWTVGA